ncbi:hypothetical protein C8J56DRAFT_795466 [Mycena floridula]|nr:hypothetical protein C8J56DRAFT_795466 [Mycena floridula]
MEFLRPESKDETESANYHFTRVRLAWYYRPSDVSDRTVTDPRVLLAAIYSEVCDINQIRAKCYVLHRDKISDLSGWKKRPDRFYFTKLFDPYIKKEFEVIPTSDVRNLPDDVRTNLLDKYEYIVTEKETIPELTDAIRLCQQCKKWCSSAESVPCDRCKEYFHMSCVQPPLAAKPSRGYGWSCAPCSREHEEEVTSHVRHTSPVNGNGNGKPKSNAPAPRGRGRPRKDKSQAEKEENLNVKHFKLWPFRYFGQYTVPEDTLYEDDLIFPQVPVRMGPKFQAVVPELTWFDQMKSGGGDNSVEVLSVINILMEAEVESCKRALESDTAITSSVDWLTEVIRRFSDAALAAKSLSLVNMKSPMRTEMWKPSPTRYTDKPWTKDEELAFELAIDNHGAELRAVRSEIVTRTMPEVVRYYGHWKSSKIGEENRRFRNEGPLPGPKLAMYSGTERKQTVGPSDDEKSVVTAPSKAPSCGACRTKESRQWWRAPKGLATSLLCDPCGQNWRKYADLNVRPLREESVPKTKTLDKREGTPLAGPSTKRPRLLSTTDTPPPSAAVPWIKCHGCLKSGPRGKVLKCKKCQFTTHAASCGAVVDAAKVDEWLCDICHNEDTLEASVFAECLLCPRVRPWPVGKTIAGPEPDSFLRACKPTEGQGWAHLLCAVFIPEIQFTDTSRFRLVEGLSVLNTHRWTARCSLCHKTEGAVVRCSDCNREFHVSCAWDHGHKFGFEIQPVKSSRRETTVTTTFRGETGSMGPVISCKEHDRSRRDIYDICEIDDDGGETSLQVYCRAYKQAPVASTHGLLRKAKRLDQVLNIRPDPPINGSLPPDASVTLLRCHKCTTQFAPAFYHSTEAPSLWVCHRCHYDIAKVAPPNGITTPAPMEVSVN